MSLSSKYLSIFQFNTNKPASEVAIVETLVMCYLLMLEVVKENKTIIIPHRNKREIFCSKELQGIASFYS